MLLTMIATAQEKLYTPSTVPNPKNATQNGWISDPAGYLIQNHYDAITQICDQLKEYVEVELAVVMLPDFDEYRYDAFDFCQELFNSWGIGGSKKNTGILFFFCEGTRDIRIHTGGGMEGLLPDSKCGDIIDQNIELFSNGDYSRGTVAICADLCTELITDEARAELLLDYKPQTNEDSERRSLYLVACVFLLVALSVYIYIKVPQNPTSVALQKRVSTVENLSGPQTASGCLAWLFPLPMLLIYIFFRKKRKSILDAPAVCPQCGAIMGKVPETEKPSYLNQAQLAEIESKSQTHDVWHCDACGHNEIVTEKGEKYFAYEPCNVCGARTSKQISSRNIKKATYTATGLSMRTYQCACCGNQFEQEHILPKLVYEASSYSSSSSSSSSSSWGSSWGSSSSSSSSGGSWGGGHSYGGGAGRKF